MTKVVAFLPVKGKSERIKNKNTKYLDSKPLFLHTLEKIISCEFIDEVYLDSNSEKIFELAPNNGFKKIKRSKKLSTNKVDGNEILMNEIEKVDADIYIQILCTSPFIEKSTIRKGVQTLKENKKYDSVVLVKKEGQYLWEKGVPNYNLDKIPNSDNLPEKKVETTGLYMVKKNAALKNKRRIGKNPFFLEASPIESIDINYIEDFKMAELVKKGLRNEEFTYLNSLKNQLTSSLLSDTMDDLKIKGVIRGLKPNFSTKIIGRAKTLKLKKLKNNENHKKIYDALKSYESISTGDIIMVQNEASEYAYFGDLNANLAQKRGSSGAIISGATRDSEETTKMSFPVFSKDLNCKDVKERAVLESMNEKISIEGINVCPEDLIFADSEGIVVIPKDREKKILKEAINRKQNEDEIKTKIQENRNINKILEENGFF